ncbi:UNVERIFIED_CONTAM: cupin, partial [Salmonella enterica subsp. enterica serovar Weltevreden]
ALYLPRGWLHAATAQGEVSIHLTLGIHNWTRFAVAEQLAQVALAHLQDDPAMRASLPLGESRPDADVLERIKQAMIAAVTEADPTA